MSRWLDLAKVETPFDASTSSTNPLPVGVRNVENVEVSKGGEQLFPRLAYSAVEAEDDALAMAAIEGGDRTYGAVATTTGMGASRAWRAWERLRADGRLKEVADKPRNPDG